MMVRVLALFAFATLLAACGGQPSSDSGEEAGSGGATKPPNSSPVAASRVLWNDQQGTCLDSNNRPGYNSSAIGQNSQCVDYSNQDLTGQDFSNFDLRGSNFRNAVLVGVKFDGAQLKGLILTGAEVESTCILNWLTSGVAPAGSCAAPATSVAVNSPVPAPAPPSAPAPTPAPSAVAPAATPSPVPVEISTSAPSSPAPIATPTPASVPVADNSPAQGRAPATDINSTPVAPPVTTPVTPIIVEAPPAETPSTPPAPIVDVTQILSGVHNAQDVPAYLDQVTAGAELDSQRLHIKLKALRMQRWAQQSMARIEGAVVKDDHKDLAGVSGKDETAIAAVQQILDKDEGEQDVAKTKVKTLVTQIHQADHDYSQYVHLKDAAGRVSNLVQKYDKRKGSFSQQFNSGKDFAAAASALQAQTDSLRKQIEDLKNERAALKQTLFAFDDRIDTLTNELDELNAEKETGKGNKGKSDSTQAANAKGQLTSQIAQLRADRAKAQAQLTDLDGRIQSADQQLKSAENQLHENNLLAKINQIISG